MERATRYSRKREAILEAIQNTQVHPTADWIYQKLKTTHPDLSLGTVYRNLSFFREQGLIKSVGVVDGQERFDGHTEPHSHFICAQCGAVIDLRTMSLNRELDAVVEQEYGFSISGHELTFHGVCSVCKSTQPAQ